MEEDENSKQVRVDNWGAFFLQRLQVFFSKTEYCDLTLQFQDNAQLKVHRLVLNACTEFFEYLENSDSLIAENTVMMPGALQANVVVPIINFMYTGLLEYPTSIFQQLYQAAELLHMSILTKLLDAQRTSVMPKQQQQSSFKTNKIPCGMNSPSTSSSPASNSLLSKNFNTKRSFADPSPSLLSTPKTKTPVWKKKVVPHALPSFARPEPRSSAKDYSRDTAKPTRFEWPEDDMDIPPLDIMDSAGFGDISYTSKPLLREDDVKSLLQSNSGSKDAKEQDKPDADKSTNDKRKYILESDDKFPKRIKIDEGEKDTVISVTSDENSGNLDPVKLVSEIFKKFPQVMKRKNIKLKILSKQKENVPESNQLVKTTTKNQEFNVDTSKIDEKNSKKETTWCCKECTEQAGQPHEFQLYFLYRKHMTEMHNVWFDSSICKYCGVSFPKEEIHAYHLYTKHGIKPTNPAHVFPSCSRCPYVALSQAALHAHWAKHQKAETQCSTCKLAFNSSGSLSAHIQKTGHMSKIKGNLHDCQYCLKTPQSAISLLCHIKNEHEDDGKKDGIVSLDEEDPEHISEHYEIIAENNKNDCTLQDTNKVKILSDVKVTMMKKDEVEVNVSKLHTNISNTMSTNLELLDIVVLDENQQFILQDQGQSAEKTAQYILPDSAETQTLESTTDELVMVLTDQDYKDSHGAIGTDNSNIVVLYSHPADGQQTGQFITTSTDGNLMVNSETGMLEIRNGATTPGNQIVVTDDNHIETIEMIQKEIEGGAQPMKEVEQPNQPEEVVMYEQPEIKGEETEVTPTEILLEPTTNTQDENIEKEVMETEKADEEKVNELHIDEEATADDCAEIQCTTSEPMEVSITTSTEENKLEVEAQEEPIGKSVPSENVEETEDLKEDTKDDMSPEVVHTEHIVDEMKPYSPTDNPIDIQSESDTNDKQDSIVENESSVENVDANDDESQSSQSSSHIHKIAPDSPKEPSKISILDDWEDTDSQQSEQKGKSDKKVPKMDVNKLMDDWEEEVEK